MLRIEELRMRRGYPQSYVAERLGVKQCTISQWENGNRLPGVEKLPALAEVLGVTVNDLFEPTLRRLLVNNQRKEG